MALVDGILGLSTWELVAVGIAAGLACLFAVFGTVWLLTQMLFWWEEWR